jgi:1,4-alpha-glucan branching enzyme
LNKLYRAEPALSEADYDYSGFFWVDCSDHDHSVLSFVRKNRDQSSVLLVVLNLTPVVRDSYRVGLPLAGFWREVLNSDSEVYGGSNAGNLGGKPSEPIPMHAQPHSAALRLPPLSVVIFKHET